MSNIATSVPLPYLLRPNAGAIRRDFVKWIHKDAKEGSDWVLNERGDRIYYTDKVSGFVKPLLEGMEMGLEDCEYSMWRYSKSLAIEPSRGKMLYIIPIDIISGSPHIVQDGSLYHIFPGCHMETRDVFYLAPELDVLFVIAK